MFGFYSFCAAKLTNYLVDIIIVLVLIGFALVCSKKGFIECFFNFVSTVAAVLVAVLLAKAVISLTGGLFGLQDTMMDSFEKAFLKIEGFDLDISTNGLQAALAEKNIPDFLAKMVVDTFGNKEIAEGTTLAMAVGGTLAKYAITFITWIVLFLITRLILRILKSILTKLAEKITLIGAVNTLLGCVVGLIEGLLLIYAVLAVLALIPSDSITVYLNNSFFVGWLYNHNLINLLLGWIVK